MTENNTESNKVIFNRVKKSPYYPDTVVPPYRASRYNRLHPVRYIKIKVKLIDETYS